MVAPSVVLPRVTLDLVRSPQKVGIAGQRALIVGQLSPGVRATGKVVFAANPVAAATVTLGGTAITFVASGATANQVNIGASLSATLIALAANLNANVDTNITKAQYVVSGTTLFVINKTAGTAGNSFTLAASVAIPSGATLTGGLASTGSATAGMLVSDIGHTAAEDRKSVV